MAAAETHLDLKIFFHKERNRVLFAEANGDFIDVLFSFLTLPLGTIVRLIGKTQSTEPSNVGCFSNLYQSVKSLGNEHFCAEVCKEMLVQPRSSSEDRYRMLKINIDDTEAKYFSCSHKCLSIYQNTICRYCRGPLSIVKSLGSSTCSSKVYVTEASKFIITEDLRVKPVVPGTVIALLSDLGINDMSSIGEQTVKLGLKELLELLKLTLLSTAPLTDLVVSKEKMSRSSVLKKQPLLKTMRSAGRCNKGWKVSVNVVVKKSSKEFLFLEAGQDFIDFLVSFLIIPLGEMLHILDGQSGLRSIDCLYKSVMSLDSQYFISEDKRNVLLRPKLPPQFGLNNSLFKLEATPLSCNIDGIVRTMPVDSSGTLSVARGSGGFLRKETSFLVSDGLMITPLSAESFISMYSRNKVSVSDLEERTVSLGAAEGISILRASLVSSSAISDGLLQNSLIF